MEAIGKHIVSEIDLKFIVIWHIFWLLFWTLLSAPVTLTSVQRVAKLRSYGTTLVLHGGFQKISQWLFNNLLDPSSGFCGTPLHLWAFISRERQLRRISCGSILLKLGSWVYLILKGTNFPLILSGYGPSIWRIIRQAGPQIYSTDVPYTRSVKFELSESMYYGDSVKGCSVEKLLTDWPCKEYFKGLIDVTNHLFLST